MLESYKRRDKNQGERRKNGDKREIYNETRKEVDEGKGKNGKENKEGKGRNCWKVIREKIRDKDQGERGKNGDGGRDTRR